MADEGGYAEGEVTTQSGVSRYCNAMFTAVCVAPVVILLAVILLGWNEHRAVCEQGTISSAQDAVLQNGCASGIQNSGHLVMFHCNLSKTGLLNTSVPKPVPAPEHWWGLSGQSVGLKIVSSMMQCVEERHSEVTKDKIGGGTRTTYTYTYKVQYEPSYVNDTNTFNKGYKNSSSWRDDCGVDNPPWPLTVPQSATQYVDSAMLGPYNLTKEWVSMVPLDFPLKPTAPTEDWFWEDMLGIMTKDSGKKNNIGNLMVQFMVNDWSRATMTGLAKNSGGNLTMWTAPKTWICSNYTLGKLQQGVIDKANLFKDLSAKTTAMTFGFRFLGFFLMWFGFCAVFAPLEVAADCVPGIGPCLGDSVHAVTTCVTCPLACSCSLAVIGVVWVFMRPMVGLPLLLVFCAVVGASVYLKLQQQKRKAAARENAGIRENLYQS